MTTGKAGAAVVTVTKRAVMKKVEIEIGAEGGEETVIGTEAEIGDEAKS